ncbi:vitamin K epoxide reductase family protein [Candidatus Microgenomates bacterium]|nr:vitamin K epoxide reductase family protein [Candidatus Microgenomates bacterium]
MLVNRFIFFFSLVGLAISGFLLYEQNFTGSITCPFLGSGCQTVWSSPYSNIYGVSLSVIGLAFYALIMATVIWKSISNQKVIIQIQFWLVFIGLVYSAYLTFLEAFVIRAYCVWCLASFIVIIAIFILTVVGLHRR